MPAPHSLAFKLRKARFHLLIVEPQLCCDVSNHNVAPNKNLNRQKAVSIFGRSDGIRTHDLYVPNVALYQAELHSEKTNLFYILFLILQAVFYNIIRILFAYFFTQCINHHFSGGILYYVHRRLVEKINQFSVWVTTQKSVCIT